MRAWAWWQLLALCVAGANQGQLLAAVMIQKLQVMRSLVWLTGATVTAMPAHHKPTARCELQALRALVNAQHVKPDV